MMGFHFGHGHEEVGGKDGIRKEELIAAGEVLDRANVVSIEVDKIIFKAFDALPIAGFLGEAECVAAMAWAFGNGDGGGTEGSERGEGSGDQSDVRIDGGGGIELDEIGLEYDAFIFNLESAKADASEDMADEVFLVTFRFEHGDGRGAGEGCRRCFLA